GGTGNAAEGWLQVVEAGADGHSQRDLERRFAPAVVQERAQVQLARPGALLLRGDHEHEQRLALRLAARHRRRDLLGARRLLAAGLRILCSRERVQDSGECKGTGRGSGGGAHESTTGDGLHALTLNGGGQPRFRGCGPHRSARWHRPPGHQTLTRCSGGRNSLASFCTANAVYHASWLRTVSARYSPGACTFVFSWLRSAG